MHVCACTRPRAQVPTCTHARTRKHTHTHTPICNTFCFSTASMLRYTCEYIACLVYIHVYFRTTPSYTFYASTRTTSDRADFNANSGKPLIFSISPQSKSRRRFVTITRLTSGSRVTPCEPNLMKITFTFTEFERG
jgi:hypothetical protein